jgi:hypothetical protein
MFRQPQRSGAYSAHLVIRSDPPAIWSVVNSSVLRAAMSGFGMILLDKGRAREIPVREMSMITSNPQACVTERAMKPFFYSRRIVQATGRAHGVARTLMFIMLILVPVQIVRGQELSPPAGDCRDLSQELLKRVEQLEIRIRELEAKQGKSSPTQLAVANPTAKTDQAEAEQEAPVSREPYARGWPVMEIHGFGSFELDMSNPKTQPNSLALGEFDLLMTSRLSERLSVLGELEVGATEHGQFGIELERLVLQYSASDHLNLAFGRHFNGIGYYNTAYHNGDWLQTAIDRPLIVEHEDAGGILPIHSIGFTASGQVPSGSLGLQYVAEIGNGRTWRSPLDNTRNPIDEHNSTGVNLALLARPDGIPGLQAGFSVYHDRLAPDGMPKMGQTIMAAHVVYQTPAFEFLNEAILIRHTVIAGDKVFNTAGFYTQVSRRFGKFRPYFRYEYVNAPDDEPLYSDLRRLNGPVFGLRYDFSRFAAFKAQYEWTSRRQLPAINELTLQLAFTF